MGTKRRAYLSAAFILALALLAGAWMLLPATANPGCTLTLQTDKATYRPGETVHLSGNLMDNGAPVAAASVGLQVTNPEQANVFLDMASTEADGRFAVAFVSSQSAVSGQYVAYVSYSSCNATTNFEIGGIPVPEFSGVTAIMSVAVIGAALWLLRQKRTTTPHVLVAQSAP